jgi:pimeloyl-ACP methyl ester carboxylesterase
VPYDSRLYTTQMLLVLASSTRPWDTFHLVGYSLGGGLAAAFARYLPHRVTSLVLMAGGGLIRADRHVGWRGRLLYNWDVLPGWLVRRLVRSRIRPATSGTAASSSAPTTISASETPPTTTSAAIAMAVATATRDVDVDIARAESGTQQQQKQKNADASGGARFDGAGVSRRWRPGVSVSAVVAWQVDQQYVFIAFLFHFLGCLGSLAISWPRHD